MPIRPAMTCAICNGETETGTICPHCEADEMNRQRRMSLAAPSALVDIAQGKNDGIVWPDSEGQWIRDGEQWTAKRTADGEMWIIPPCPEDGCVPRSLAALAQPPVLGRWVKSLPLPDEGGQQP